MRSLCFRGHLHLHFSFTQCFLCLPVLASSSVSSFPASQDCFGSHFFIMFTVLYVKHSVRKKTFFLSIFPTFFHLCVFLCFFRLMFRSSRGGFRYCFFRCLFFPPSFFSFLLIFSDGELREIIEGLGHRAESRLQSCQRNVKVGNISASRFYVVFIPTSTRLR